MMGTGEDRNRYEFSQVGELLKVVSGVFDRNRTTLFSIFRDEMFFCNAFFDHYRRLGIDQFLIIDDRSEDGTSRYLRKQPDCVVLTSQFSYGDEITILDRDGTTRRIRAGIFFKMAVPAHFLQDRFVLYVDADEFLFLPESVRDLPELCRRIHSNNEHCVVASIVEFFPEKVSDLEIPFQPETPEDLLFRYPFIENEPVIRLGGKKGFRNASPSKSTRLFQQFDIRNESPAESVFSKLKRRLSGKAPRLYRKTPKSKIPLLFNSAGSFFTGTHEASKRVSQDYILTIAHFVFTYQFSTKIERARAWRSYASNSEKYDLYMKLLDKMKRQDASLVGPNSVRFRGTRTFMECGLMAGPDPEANP